MNYEVITLFWLDNVFRVSRVVIDLVYRPYILKAYSHSMSDGSI